MNQKKRLTRGRKKTCKIEIENSQTSAARQLLNKPVDDTILFAGDIDQQIRGGGKIVKKYRVRHRH